MIISQLLSKMFLLTFRSDIVSGVIMNILISRLVFLAVINVFVSVLLMSSSLFFHILLQVFVLQLMNQYSCQLRNEFLCHRHLMSALEGCSG